MKLVKSIFEYLNAHCCYAVLRNYEELPETNRSRDIDIIIEKNEFKRNNRALINVITQSGYKIVSYYKSDRLLTYVCGSTGNNTVDIIQLDFFFHTSIYGLVLLDAPEMLSSRLFNGKVFHVSKEIEFLDKFLYAKVVGKQYPEKYRHILDSIKDNELVSNYLKNIFNAESISEVDKYNSKTLFWHTFWANSKKNPIKHSYNLILFWFFYIKSYIFSETGIKIGFTGADGSGKTTIITGICDKLSGIYSSAAVLFHFRPTVLSNLGETANSLGLNQEVDRNYDKPHRGEKTSIISSFTRLLYYSFDYIIGYFIKVKPVCRLTRLLIFDRYYTDIIVDSRRSRIFLNHKFLHWFGKFFIPKLDYNILLTADKEVILARKQELNEEGIEEINKKLNYLSDKKGYYLVFNNGKPEEAIQKILTIVFDGQHKKNRKRIGK